MLRIPLQIHWQYTRICVARWGFAVPRCRSAEQRVTHKRNPCPSSNTPDANGPIPAQDVPSVGTCGGGFLSASHRNASACRGFGGKTSVAASRASGRPPNAPATPPST